MRIIFCTKKILPRFVLGGKHKEVERRFQELVRDGPILASNAVVPDRTLYGTLDASVQRYGALALLDTVTGMLPLAPQPPDSIAL